MKNARLPSYTGRCNCGAVSFTIDASPQASNYCHCTICRRHTGAPVLLGVKFPKDSLNITGATKEWPSSATGRRHFCPTCGSSLFFSFTDRPETMEVMIGALDSTDNIYPTHHVWMENAISWFKIDDELTSYARMPNQNWVESEGILEGKQPIPDISRLSGFDMVVSPRAYNTLQPVLAGYGEFFVVPFKGEIYYLFRCLNRVDKVDPDNSSLNEYNEAIGLKFLPGDVEGQLIWATTYGVTRGLFCGAELEKIVQDAGLTGLVFDEKLTSWVP